MMRRGATWGITALLWTACGGTPEPIEGPAPAPEPPTEAPAPRAVPQPPPNREVPLPTVDVALPAPHAVAHPLTTAELVAELRTARQTLAKVVNEHGRDPDNPWAVSHSMLALGSDIELTNGVPAVDHLFATYGETVDVGTAGPGDDLGIAFPRKRGDIRIEPHSDLILKALVEGGVSPDRPVTVQGKPGTVKALYRHSLHRTWVTSGSQRRTSLDSMNDTPWALQALSGWAPPGYRWTAIGGHDMTMDGFATADLDELEMASAELMAAMARGAMPRKDGKGILGYTCGGQHLIQGVAHAVARGFGPDDGKPRVCAQRDLLRWRLDHELGTLDPMFKDERVLKDQALQILLLDQRLKFVGHALETLSKIDAYGYCDWTEADTQAHERLAIELVRTVKALDGLGVWADLQGVRANKALDPYRPNSGGAEQVYLDLLGDSAHAVRGIDLALGEGRIAY